MTAELGTAIGVMGILGVFCLVLGIVNSVLSMENKALREERDMWKKRAQERLTPPTEEQQIASAYWRDGAHPNVDVVDEWQDDSDMVVDADDPAAGLPRTVVKS